MPKVEGHFLFGAAIVLVGIRLAVVIAKSKTTPLPPPEDDQSQGGVTEVPGSAGGQDGELRGLKGHANPIASLQQGLAKCSVDGSYGIHGDCSKYVECRKKGIIPAFKYCPSGKFFDHLKRSCVKSSDAECKNVCPEEGSILPDPEEDEGYLKCQKGVPMPYACPTGQSFVPKKKTCSGGGLGKE